MQRIVGFACWSVTTLRTPGSARAVSLWVYTGAKIWAPFFLKKNGTSMHYPVAGNRETALMLRHRFLSERLLHPILKLGKWRRITSFAQPGNIGLGVVLV